MRQFLSMLILGLAVFLFTSQYSYATAKQDNCNFVNIENASTPQVVSTLAPQDGVGSGGVSVTQSQDWLDFIIDNKIYLLGLMIWLVNRFVPTKWKDPLVKLLEWLNRRLPDNKKNGGSHNGK